MALSFRFLESRVGGQGGHVLHTPLGLRCGQDIHHRVAAVLTFLREAGLHHPG